MLLLVQLPASREEEDEGGDKDVVVVTGGMDLMGRVHGVVGLAGKLQVRQGGHGPRFSLHPSPCCRCYYFASRPALTSAAPRRGRCAGRIERGASRLSLSNGRAVWRACGH
jgi:hypothetical protein